MRLRGVQEGPAAMGDLLATLRGVPALWRGFHAGGAVLALLGLSSSAPVSNVRRFAIPYSQMNMFLVVRSRRFVH